jgi:hypothetical protein
VRGAPTPDGCTAHPYSKPLHFSTKAIDLFFEQEADDAVLVTQGAMIVFTIDVEYVSGSAGDMERALGGFGEEILEHFEFAPGHELLLATLSL